MPISRDIAYSIGFFIITFTVLMLHGSELIFQSYYPIGDVAADMLLENTIDQEGFLLTGHYSRFRFNHPGPFFFYVHHFAHSLFDFTPIAKTTVWAGTTLFLNTAFLTLAAFLASKLTFSKVSILAMLVFTLTSLSILKYSVFSEWMPYRLVTPYMAFLLCLIFISLRNFRFLPLAIALASILIHGYVTLILFTLPMLIAAVFYGYATNPGKIDRREIIHILCGLSIGAIFASPILIDIIISNESNLEKILQALKKTTVNSSFFETINFTSDIFLKNITVLHFFIFLIAVVFPPRNVNIDRVKTTFFYAISCITIIFIAYYKTAPKPLVEMIGIFYWSTSISLISLAAVSIVIPATQMNKKTNHYRAKTLTCILLVFISLVSFRAPKARISDNFYIYQLSKDIQKVSKDFKQVYIDYESHDLWPLIAGVLLELNHQNYDSCTTWGHMAFLYTESKVCKDDKVTPITIVKAKNCNNRCSTESGIYGIISN